MNMNTRFCVLIRLFLIALLPILSWPAQAVIPGITGSYDGGTNTRTFDIYASPAAISTPDGDSLLIWAYGESGALVQYPGPTLLINEGENVVVNLSNGSSPSTALMYTGAVENVSMIFPGQANVAASGGNAGLMTQESTSDTDTVSYSFAATHPGTYTYHSGTRQDLQVEMGLLGAIIIRPQTNPDNQAYNHPDSTYDHEYLFLLTEMDPEIHQMVDFGMAVDTSNYDPVLWFINGRNGPDTLFDHFAPWVPHQPYSSLARMRPGEKTLMRVIGGGRDMHPFHAHGNHFWQVARDGRMMSSSANSGADLGVSDYTLQVLPGATYDAIFEWTGAGMGFDIYGHTEGDGSTCNGQSTASDSVDPVTFEDCNFHNVGLPVVLPENQDLTFGGFYSGSPFLGVLENLPPGEGGLNLNGGLFFMWHSHTEKELVNNDVFPGGMMTMMIIEPPGVPIP